MKANLSIVSFEEVKERTIPVNACSKTQALTGWSAGEALASFQKKEKPVKFMVALNTCANSIARKAIAHALEGPEDSIHEKVNPYRRRGDLMGKNFNQTGFLRDGIP